MPDSPFPSCTLPIFHGTLQKTLAGLDDVGGSWQLTAEHGPRRLKVKGQGGDCHQWELQGVGPRLGDVLLDAGKLCQAELDGALRAQRRTYQGRFRLGRVLCDIGLLEAVHIAQARRTQLCLAVFEINHWGSGNITVEFDIEEPKVERWEDATFRIQSLMTLEVCSPMLRRIESLADCQMDLSTMPSFCRLERDLVYRYRDSLGRVVVEMPIIW